VFLNDFVVNGYGILTDIKEGVDYEKLNDNEPDPNGPIAMVGAGTGLGHGYLVKNDKMKYYQVYPSEGGHQDFAPHDDLEWRYFKYLQTYYDVEHISVERACAGPAIPVMYRFFVESEKMQSDLSSDQLDGLTSEEIVQKGLKKECKICETVIDFFVAIYGAAAGNMSLLLLPTGGLFLLGGLSVALENYIIKNDTFRV
jgi:glucokinase